MLAASPHNPLTQSVDQSLATGVRRNPRGDLQGDPFENANTVSYFRSHSAHTHQSFLRSNQVHGGVRAGGPYGAAPVEDQIYRNSAEAQFEVCIPDSLRNFGIWLQESLQELAECPFCAQEEEMDEPSSLALAKAKELLERVANYVMDCPEIYPMQHASIAIDFCGPDSRSGVLFLIEQDGSGVLFHRTDNSKGRIRVDDAAELLKEGGIRELKRVGIQ